MKTKEGFTLIELLVVIAIIAILAAILFPVFAQAKLAAKKTVSLSNLKQIELSLILYSNDYDDFTMPAYYTQDGFASINWWWGYQNPNGTGTTDVSKGLLVPYAKSTGINADPVFTDLITANSFGSLGYGYNYDYLTIGDANFNQNGISNSSVQVPASTVAFVTSAQWDNFSSPTPFLAADGNIDAPSYNDPNVQGRYGGQGIVAWCDGHAKTVTPVFRSGDMPTYSGPITVATLKSTNLGDVSPITLPADCSVNPSLYDQYYELQKPSGY